MPSADAHQHSHSDHPSGGPGTEIDPVCGMTVDPASAAGSVEHGGKTYYFCSTHCVEKFRADPERYLAPSPPAALVQISSIGPAPPGTPASVEYTCPMHPEVVSDRPRACPKCGMALEPP